LFFWQEIFSLGLMASDIAIRGALHQMLGNDHKDAMFGGQTSLTGTGDPALKGVVDVTGVSGRNKNRLGIGGGRPMLSRLSLTAWIIAAVIGLAPALGPAAAQEEQENRSAPYGVWMPEDEESKVEIYPCGEAMCGRVAWMQEQYDENGKILTDIYNPDPDLRSTPVLGLVIMTDILPTDDEGVWRGRVYNPQDGRTYDFWLTVKSESQIIIEGCGLYNLICQKHTWDRVDS
jgi:uncharacterized protein (DUF2147 family)